MEDDAPGLRGVANVVRAAGCEVPDWVLALKKARHHRKPKAPAAGRISTEPRPEGGKKASGQWRQKGGKPGAKGGGKPGAKGAPQQQRQQKGGTKRPAEGAQRRAGGTGGQQQAGGKAPAQKKARKAAA